MELLKSFIGWDREGESGLDGLDWGESRTGRVSLSKSESPSGPGARAGTERPTEAKAFTVGSRFSSQGTSSGKRWAQRETPWNDAERAGGKVLPRT